MNSEKYSDMIEIMALHEEAISDFYAAAAQRFTNKDLWNYLSKEESKHAMWLRSIADNVSDESITFTAEGLSIKAYMESTAKISSEKTAIEEKRRKLSQVFEFAVSIENGMLEKNFLDGFTSPSKGIRGTLNKLKKDTEEHSELLKKAFGEYKKQKEKYIENKKKAGLKKEAEKAHSNQPVQNNNRPGKEEKPDIKKLTVLKRKQDEVQTYLEENDSEWIEQYKQTISKISESHAELKNRSESSDHEIKSFEQEKEQIAVKIMEDISLPEEASVEFIIYHYIGLHSEYERQLSNLYKLFEHIFPNDELWPFMAEEERKHEYWLKDIIKKMNDGTIIFSKPSYSPDLVLKAIINVAEMIHYCKEFKITHKEAYTIAFDQENSILEDRFFGNFSSDAPAIEKVFGMLIEDTIEHREWLKRRMDFYNY